MELKDYKDSMLLAQIKVFIQAERDQVIKILQHLREIDRRKLYCDLGYRSLFDYAVSELRYSEGQASRRIQAMRLIKEIPEIEAKIAAGDLSLSNVQQAQSLFRELQSNNPRLIVAKTQKMQVLSKLENKSVREGHRELIKLHPIAALPKEQERLINASTTEVKFLMSDKLKTKLDEVRSLLGSRKVRMSYAALFDAMSELSVEALKAKRFGKKRAAPGGSPQGQVVKKSSTLATSAAPAKTQRQPSKALQHAVWLRDRGRCRNCGSTHNLNYDHIKPVALGGETTIENLRLLCFHCNQRASIKTYGRIYQKSG